MSGNKYLLSLSENSKLPKDFRECCLKKNSNKNKKYDSEDSMDEGIIKFTA